MVFAEVVMTTVIKHLGEHIMTTLDWEKAEVFCLLKNAPGTQYQEADEAGQAEIRAWVKGLLITSEITVDFVKADGTERSMRCTLDSNRIPPVPAGTIFKSSTANPDGLAESKKPRKQPDPHSVRVFDTEKGEWRSFRFDRLQKITAELDFAAK
ncbi:SH3 beta-barrel fold-containing protein [Haliscomenobacter sp.]|uniref:SH3 beta-barrel fold-containing protein n=1 Tax=Haliscomenobacter sp. TaxID=2717303 RepID=UPI0033650D9E